MLQTWVAVMLSSGGNQCSKFLPTSDAVVVVPFMLGSIVSAAETQFAMVFQEG
jgi:hypothetical protein